MQTYKTHIFSIQAPKNFEVQKENAVSIQLQDPSPQSEVQNPSIQITLQHLSAYDYIEAETLQAQFYKGNLGLRYKAQTIETFEIPFQDQTAYVQLAETRDTFQGEPLEVNYYFVLFPINAQYAVEMLCDVLTKDWEEYRPQFEAVWQSLSFHTELDLAQCEKAEALHEAQLKQEMQQGYIEAESQATKEMEEWIENYIQSIEKTDKNIFQLGDYNFDLVWDKQAYSYTKWFIGNGKFYCEIVAQTNQATLLQSQQILSEYNDKGQLKISFELQNIYQNGIPQAELWVKNGDIESSQYANFRIDGTHYKWIYFEGKIFIHDKGIQIFGLLQDGLINDKKYPINIQVAFAVADLDWKKYIFTTLEELQTAPDELIETIVLNNPIAELSEDLRRFKNLKTLSIGHQHQKSSTGLTTLPPWIAQFINLENLHINNASLSELPKEISQLSQLKYLHIFNTQLQTLPDTIWQMSILESLHLRDNQLKEIPENIQLPRLKYLDLSRNQLTSLPESLVNLPQLQTLYLEGNPWKFIPQQIEKIASIHLEIAYKRQFFDFEYQGADGEGITGWNDTLYFAKYDEELMQSITNYWQEEAVKPYQKDLQNLMKKAIGFQMGEDENYTQVGNHRIGGMPDLPQHISYPKFVNQWSEDKESYCYEFIAQINCSEIAHLQEYLPRTGMLYFFLSTIHDVYENAEAAKVIYFEGTQSSLASGTQFHFTKDDYYEAFEDVPYTGKQAEAYKFVSLPDFYPIHQNEYLLEGLSQSFQDKLENDVDNGYVFNEAFDAYAKGDVAINSYGFSQHEYPEHEVALKHKGNPQDWLILLRVPSVGNFEWGDAGDLFFVIHKSDFVKKDFSKVVCTMYSS